MRTNKRKDNNQYLLELAIFLASSTRDVIKWKHYGSIRLFHSLIKLLGIPNHVSGIKKDQFLDNIRFELKNNTALLSDEVALTNFLDDLIVKMLKEYKSRLTMVQ